MYFDQSDFPIRCEWGLEAVNRLAPTSDVVVIVDIISFTSSVDVAVSRGGRVYPYRGSAEGLAEFARSLGAILANSSRKDPAGFSLAPSSMLRLPPGSAVVLPSLNGSTLSLATGNTPTFAGCLRNAGAVAAACASLGQRITIIPAGERWGDGSLRPALEDWLGAGAILHALQGSHLPPGSVSPEAQAAAAAFIHFREILFNTLATCGSGKEAANLGSIEDIRLAADLDASTIAPLLFEGAYQAYKRLS
jgi:2-phosphosulfolactate phosphatase